MSTQNTRTLHAARLDRYKGCLLGGAVGDALGAPVEFMSLDAIRGQFGPVGIQGYAPAYGRLGAITDDTQMTLFTAEGVLRAARAGAFERDDLVVRREIALAYQRWFATQGRHHDLHAFCLNGDLVKLPELHAQRAPGLTCLESLRRMRSPEDLAQNDSKGCGGVMRIAPIAMMCATMATPQTLSWWVQRSHDLACDAAAITHGHPTGQLASGALSSILTQVLSGVGLSDAIANALAILRNVPCAEETIRAICKACELAENRPSQVDVVCELGEGWVAEEALAIGLYCALCAADFRQGVLLAVNHGGDSDSTGSIAGQLLGAKNGFLGLQLEWVIQLELMCSLRELAHTLMFKD